MFSARQITFCGLIVLFYKNRNKKKKKKKKKRNGLSHDLNPESWTKNFRGFICQKKKEKNMVMQKC